MSNRLAATNSPYLLQHADNPVDWYPWGAEAFQASRHEDKPIFLSIGYAACHWCHVMAHESFEDPTIAAIMNEHFVNVKVDREERPDIDSIYMDAVVALTGQGGWPMSVFLTPQGEPFFGGTYFPPARRGRLPSFREVLEQMHLIWSGQRERAQTAGAELLSRLATSDDPHSAATWNRSDLDRAAENLHRSFDWTNGGWGQAPKFPQSTAIEFLLARYARHGDKLARDLAIRSLRRMADGGVFDQLGGGFARYSVDSRWLVPHFEKMLYDNALLVPAYVRAWQLTGDSKLLSVAEMTLEFLRRELRDPNGGYHSSIDADSQGVEGQFYLWTTEQIRRVLSDSMQRELFSAAYGVSEAGDFEGANILHRTQSDIQLVERFGLSRAAVEEGLAIARGLLLQARSERIRPQTDDKVLTAWNGFALTALSEHARATGSQESLKSAQTLAGFLLDEMHGGGRLLRSWRRGQSSVEGFLEDHASLGMGLLDLYSVDFQPRWFAAARDLVDEIMASFYEPEHGFYDTHAGAEELVRRPMTVQDSPTPSGSSLATRLLLRMDSLDRNEGARRAAEGVLDRWSQQAPSHPTAFASWLLAAESAMGATHQLALVGDPEDGRFQALAQVAWDRYLPGLAIAGGPPELEDQPELLKDRQLAGGLPTAYFCEDFACRLPTSDPAELVRQLDGSR